MGIDPKRLKAASFEGGGICGVAYAGALEALEAHLPRGLRSLEALAGTSAGGLTALLVALGLSAREVRTVVRLTDWSSFARLDPWAIVCRQGLFSAAGPRRWIAAQIAAYGRRGETFAGLHRRTGRELTLFAIDESAGQVQAFSHLETPDVPLALAALASMAIQGIYPPVEIDGRWLSDGGLVINDPIGCLASRPLEEVVGFRVDRAEELEAARVRQRPRLFLSRLVRLFDVARHYACLRHVPEALWARMVRVNVGTIRATDFDLAPDRLRWLLTVGELAARQAFESGEVAR